MKKLFASFVLLLLACSCFGCSNNSQPSINGKAPSYTGMNISNNVPSRNYRHGRVDDDKYVLHQGEEFLFEIHFDNPNAYEIQSFTINGKKYANYMFESGSTLETLYLKDTAPTDLGVCSYTIDAIKYIDGEAIKDVVIKGEQTIDAKIVQAVATIQPNNGVDEPYFVNLSYGEYFEFPNVTRNGYEFLGWFNENDEPVHSDIFYYTSDVVFTAFWRIVEYKITYDLNGGEFPPEDEFWTIPSSYTIETSGFYLPLPFKAGYEFLGWSDEEGNLLTLIKSGSHCNYHLTAVWSSNEYTVTLNYNYNDLEPKTIVIKAGEEIDLTPPIREGYTFNGWYDVAGNKYEGGIFNAGHSLELYAEWIHTNTLNSVRFEDQMFDGNAYTVRALNDQISGEIVIPAKYNGKFVISVMDGGFNCPNITKFSFDPQSRINNLFGNVFNEKCTSLVSVSLPKTIEILSFKAFSGLTALKEVDMPGVTQIESSAFENCTGLENIILPDSLITIGGVAFKGCTSLKTVTLGDNVTTIKENAFSGCTSLEIINVPKSVTVFGHDVFNDCNNVAVICEAEEKGQNWSDGWDNDTALVLWGTKGNPVIKQNDDYKYFVLNDKANIIEYFGSGDTVAIPEYIDGYEVNSYYSSIITNLSAYKDGTLKSFTAPKDVISTGFKNIIFNDFTFLQEFTIPNGVTKIRSNMFAGCKLLKSIDIPDSVIIIEEGALSNCNLLKKVNIGKGATSFAAEAFNRDTSLTEINVDEDNPNIFSDGKCVYSYEDQTLLVCARGISGEYVVANGTKHIQNRAFDYCKLLTSILLPEGLLTIGHCSFADCVGITSLNLPSSLIDIDTWAFTRTGLESIVIPEGMNYLKYNTFESCGNLEYVILPASVLVIDNGAFVYCSNLKYVFYLGTQEQLDEMSIGTSSYSDPTYLCYNESPTEEGDYWKYDSSHQPVPYHYSSDGNISYLTED